VSSASKGLIRAVELLLDGQWHDYEEVARAVADAVEPGPARRNYDVHIARRQLLRPHLSEPQLAVSEQIARGARRAAGDVLAGPAFERDPNVRVPPPGVRKRVRLRYVPPRAAFVLDAPNRRTEENARKLRRAAREGDDERVERVLRSLKRADLEAVLKLWAHLYSRGGPASGRKQ
jgi:hypothetical protein